MIKKDNARLTITISKDMLEQLEYYCKCRCISKTSYIRELVEKQIQYDLVSLHNARESLRGILNE